MHAGPGWGPSWMRKMNEIGRGLVNIYEVCKSNAVIKSRLAESDVPRGGLDAVLFISSWPRRGD
jgi:hypothetical protein